MAALYVAILMGVVAAVGVFATVWSVMPQPPTNADLVEGRLAFAVVNGKLKMTRTEDVPAE